MLDSRIVPIICANLGGWGKHNVAEELGGMLGGIKVLVGNDANVAALGEIWMGAAKGCRSAVMVTLGTGVGGGVIVNGKVIDAPTVPAARSATSPWIATRPLPAAAASTDVWSSIPVPPALCAA